VFRTSGRAAPRADDRIAPERSVPDAAALVTINQDSGAITVLDPSTLAERGEIQAGYRPWVAVRQTAHQLLVAQAFGPGPTVTTPTLRIYDLDDLSSPPGIIPMPDRAVSTILAPEWFLADDERYLYYGRVVPPAPGCMDDVYVCQQVSVGIIDLATREVAANISLPSGCTYPELRETAGGVLSMCLIQASSSVELRRVSSGAASLVATLALEDGPQGPATVAPVDAAQDARGDYYVVYQDGVLKSSAPSLDGFSFSSTERITVVSARLMPGGKRLLAYSTSIGVGQVNGVIVYDEHDPRQYRKIPVEGTWSDATPLTANMVALLRPGEVRVLDIDSGQLLTPTAQVPVGEEFLASG
jgi:hypothetical protein